MNHKLEARVHMPYPQRFSVEIDGHTVVTDCMNLVDALDIATWHIAMLMEGADWENDAAILINAERVDHDPTAQ